MSVFEYDLPSSREAERLRAGLRVLVNPAGDQVRVYPVDDNARRGMAVIGAWTIEERQDFWS